MIFKKPMFYMALFFLFATPSPPGFSSGDYVTKDAEGQEILFFGDEPIFTQKNPGPWAEVKHFYKPTVKIKKRMTGLEHTTILKVSFSHPMEGIKSPLGVIDTIYVLDKDDIIIVADSNIGTEEVAKSAFKISGNINYIRIYILSTKHGVWFFEMRY